ncbi:helix-turn-helix transcriptional regulator [Segatella albensis]|uniref:helix-turn-helix transcriptional regulator n=1 Tax=Segatella albensis TaxID=77768 RepID=UPI00040BEAC8|nr:helix-turn-helix transcriptional regulator [Segatella albensis]
MTTLPLKILLQDFIEQHGENSEERLRFTVFLLNFIISFIVLSTNLISILGHAPTTYIIITIGLLLVNISSIALFLTHKMSLVGAFAYYGIGSQLFESMRIIFLTVLPPENVDVLIVVNQIASYSILLYLVMGFVPRAPFIVAAMSIVTILFAGFYHGGVISMAITTLFVILMAITCFLASICHSTIHTIQQENIKFRSQQEGLLRSFQMTEEEFVVFVQLSRNNRNDRKSISRLFRKLGEQSEHNIIEAVKIRMAEKEAEKDGLSKVFPTFTPVELEVCKYVIAGHTLKEVARILNKSEKNVSAVRGRIRKKLGLVPEEDLRENLVMIAHKKK